MSEESSFPVWKQVLETVEVLEELNRHGKTDERELSEILEGLQIRLQTWNDPADHFDFFVLSRLCRALRKALSAMSRSQ